MPSFRTRELFNDSSHTLIAVESIDFEHDKARNSCQVYGSVEPIAVIVCSKNGTCALDMDGKLIDVDQLKEKVPGLFFGPSDDSPREPAMHRK